MIIKPSKKIYICDFLKTSNMKKSVRLDGIGKLKAYRGKKYCLGCRYFNNDPNVKTGKYPNDSCYCKILKLLIPRGVGGGFDRLETCLENSTTKEFKGR